MDSRCKRCNKRIMTNLQGELIIGDTRHACFIENLSDKGAYVTTAPTKLSLAFAPGLLFELKFTLPSGEKLDLHCTVVWSYSTPPHGYTNSIGLEIMDPPPKYIETLKSL